MLVVSKAMRWLRVSLDDTVDDIVGSTVLEVWFVVWFVIWIVIDVMIGVLGFSGKILRECGREYGSVGFVCGLSSFGGWRV